MKDFNIIRNNKAKILTGFSSNFEKIKEKTGKYPINGLLVVLLGEENTLSMKIMKAENFILTKDEKILISKVLERHVDPQIIDFRNGNPALDPCKNVFYKEKQYIANLKGLTYEKERDIVSAMSLYNCFNDPEDTDVIEIIYHHSI